jgi:hypothetical protein
VLLLLLLLLFDVVDVDFCGIAYSRLNVEVDCVDDDLDTGTTIAVVDGVVVVVVKDWTIRMDEHATVTTTNESNAITTLDEYSGIIFRNHTQKPTHTIHTIHYTSDMDLLSAVFLWPLFH